MLHFAGELFANTAGGDFTPHVVTVHTGEVMTIVVGSRMNISYSFNLVLSIFAGCCWEDTYLCSEGS